MQIDASMGIDGMTLGNAMRFINHSCEPNAEIKVCIIIFCWFDKDFILYDLINALFLFLL